METNMQQQIDADIKQKAETVFAAMINSEASENKRKLLKDISQKTLLTNADFGAIFNLNRRSCYTWRQSLPIPHLKIRGRIYFLLSAVIPVIESKMINY